MLMKAQPRWCDEVFAQCWAPEHRLYAAGETGRHAYMVASGIVRFERVTAAGNRRITRVAGRGDLIGQEALLKLSYREDAVICTPVTVHRLSASLVDDGEWQTHCLPHTLLSHWQDILDEAAFWSTEVSTGSARRRVLQLLSRLQHHEDPQGLIWLPKRDQVGDMLNITTETSSRVLSALRREGVLSFLPPRQARLHPERLAAALALSNH